MNFNQLQNHLRRQQSLADCAAFLAKHAQALRTLFYGAIGEPDEEGPPHATERDFEAEQALIDFLNSACGTELRSGTPPPPPVTALLIYFISLCERAGFHQRIHQVTQVLPSVSLRHRTHAAYLYKHINYASRDYTARFERIAASIQTAWENADQTQKDQCEDLAVEYFCSASAPARGIGDRNRSALIANFTDPANTSRYPFLRSARIVAALALPPDRLSSERKDANTRVAEAFYDEAALLLPVPRVPPVSQVCLATRRSHGGHCAPGLHTARQAIATKYPTEFANTGTFVKQPLDATTYTEFNNTTTCMRYFRQYMPFHMPQVEQAVRHTLDRDVIQRSRLHIMDIGGGPGTLYAVLAGLLHRGLYEARCFDITLVEPSGGFHEFLQVISQHATHPNLSVRQMCECTSDRVPRVIKRRDFDWYFIANAITPIVKGSGDVIHAVDNLCEVIRSTRRKRAPCTLTIAENTRSRDFPEVCDAFLARGLTCETQEETCDGAWLKGCEFRVAYSSSQVPAPRLKCVYIHIPTGVLES